MVSLFMGSKSDSGRAARTRALKELVRSQFKLGEDDGIFVAEIACGETDCPDVETVIAIFISGQRREFKVRKPIGAITAQDLEHISIDPAGATEPAVQPSGPGLPLTRE